MRSEAAAPFEVEWLGGLSGARLRRRRGDVESAFAWGSLARDLRSQPRSARLASEAAIDAGQRSFTDGAWNEYRTAAAFTELSRALMLARAPIDLIALASDFVVDEMVHVELNARMAMELGGAAPLFVDVEKDLVSDLVFGNLTERIIEIAIRVSCVGEALSAPLLALAARASTHPLTKSVLRRLASEEGAHGAIGFMILDWAADTDAGKRVLASSERCLQFARIAEAEVEALFGDWLDQEPKPIDGGFFVGIVPKEDFLKTARLALRQRVAAPLACRGILLDETLLERLAPCCPPLQQQP